MTPTGYLSVYKTHRNIVSSMHARHPWFTESSGPLLTCLEAKPLRVQDVAYQLNTTQQAAGKLLTAYEARGLIVSAAGVDRRARVSELTPAGREVLKQYTSACQLWRDD